MARIRWLLLLALVTFAICGCNASGNGSITWVNEKGFNCYKGRGATEIDKHSLGKLSAADCQTKCEGLQNCEGFTIDVATGDCWRRTDIYLPACDRTYGEYDTWVKLQSPDPYPQAPTGDYDQPTARTFGILSAITYCKDMTHVKDWSCQACSSSNTSLVPSSISILDVGVLNATLILIGKLESAPGCLMAFRGSDDAFNWRRDAQMKLIPPDYTDCPNCKVHYGFHKIWDTVRNQTKDAIAAAGCKPGDPLQITGHSMGAALTQLAMFTLHNDGFRIEPGYIFESPRVGNKAFVQAFNAKFPQSFRTTHAQDPYIHLPPTVLGYEHAPTEVFYSRLALPKLCPTPEDKACANQYWDVPEMLNDHTGDHCSLPFMDFNLCAANELGQCGPALPAAYV